MLQLLKRLPRSIRERVIRSQLRIDDSELEGLVVKVASTVQEHEHASRLVHAAYVRRGIMEPHASGVRVTTHGLLPSTIVFIAKRHGEVVGTLSLVLDSPLGLPMEQVFAAEIAPLRAAGRKVAEVGALCVAPHERGRGVPLLLNKLMWQVASKRLGINSLAIAVHPDAACLYDATLRFVALGTTKTYPGLTASALAVALHLDLDSAEDRLACDFGMMGADPRSPYYLYVMREHPQIQLPSDQLLRRQLAEVRSQAAKHLDSLRPDCLQSLDNPGRRLLRGVIPALRDQLKSRPILIAQ